MNIHGFSGLANRRETGNNYVAPVALQLLYGILDLVEKLGRDKNEADIFDRLLLGAVVSEDVDFISERANIDQLLTIFQMANSFYFPVIDESGTMTGVVSLQDVKGLLNDENLRRDKKVGDICTRDVIFLTLDDNLHTAMQLFNLKGIDEIPVVESKEHRWVVGMLKRRDAIAAYNREIVKRGLNPNPALPPLT